MTEKNTPVSELQAHKAEKIPVLISVASGKGGVGKTFIAVTLSHSLALSGKRILLFDGDLGLANIDVQLGLMPSHDLGSVISGRVTLAEAVCPLYQDDKASNGPQGNFDILAGKSGSGALNSLTNAQLKGLVQGLRDISQHYDLIITDLPAGIDNAVTLLSQHAILNLVVLTDEPTSLTDAYAYIKVVSRIDPYADFHIIVNQISGKTEGQRTFDALANACRNFLKLELKLAGMVRSDSKVKEAIRHQMPILARSPESRAGTDIKRIATELSLSKTAPLV